MKIQQIDLYLSRIRLKEPFIISLGALDFAEHVIIIIRTDAGIDGFGECSPFRTIHGESVETCMASGRDLAKVLLNCDPLKIEDASAVMDSCMYGNSSIKSAFDIALYDINSQHARLPLYKFLGGKTNKNIITDYTISLREPEKMASDARRILDAGFSILKVKLGGTKEKDILRMRMIREVAGPDTRIRIDANQGWNKDEALAILEALAPFDIQHCEEPIPRYDFMDLPLLKSKSPVLIMADESCCDHHDAKRLININACDGFNIKLGKSSGIYKALKIVKLGENAGMKMQAGGFLESRLGFTATAHFALSSDLIVYYDFDTPLMFSEDPIVGGITYGNHGEVTVPETPGLGARYDESFLSRLPKVIVKF